MAGHDGSRNRSRSGACAFLEAQVGDFKTRQIAVFTGAALILGVAYLLIAWIRAPGTQSLLIIGLTWVVMTVVFKVILGRAIMGLTWSRIWSDYCVSRGGLLPIGLIAIAG